MLRTDLLERLDAGLHRKLTLICAPAGFGKTTLLSHWVTGCQMPVAWLSLDEGDNDPLRFLNYLVAALQTVAPNAGHGVLSGLEAPQPPPIDAVLTVLLNELATLPDKLLLVLDDCHVIDTGPVAGALSFLLEHLPPQLHLVIATREDPPLPLARLRAQGQLSELRVADLRFTSTEVTEFLNRVMSLNLQPQDIIALETRTEGWIVGLQLAALSLQRHPDAPSFIRSFSGSHHFILDYLVEEVLQRQPESVQTFLLRTSVLERLCGPLCDAVLRETAASGQEMLEYIERANLFIVPLDDERRWYRYHHLFAELLRQRYRSAVPSFGDEQESAAELHSRASRWYEANGLELEAFYHAVVANDVDHAAHLAEGRGMPFLFRGAAAPVLNWLESLPTTVLDASPSLWVMYASALLFASRVTGVEQKLQAAEKALQNVLPDAKTRDLIGHVASIRATLAVIRHDLAAIVAESRRALEYLHPDNLPVRTATTWTLGYAYELQGDRAEAGRAYREAIEVSQTLGHTIITVMATIGLGSVQEAETQLHPATRSYLRVLELAGKPPLPVACEAHLGLARIYYEWNDLDAAEQHAHESIRLAAQLENIDRIVSSKVFLARLRLTGGAVAEATTMLAEADELAHRHNFVQRLPEVAALQVLTLLQQGETAAAAQLAETYDLPLSRARVYLAQGDTATTLALLTTVRHEAEAKGWKAERLGVMILQSIALYQLAETHVAIRNLGEALTLAEPGGFIRSFIDEGALMARLLSDAAAQGLAPDYLAKLLSAVEPQAMANKNETYSPPDPTTQHLLEPLNPRELDVLHLIAQGLSNQEISVRLFRALSTVKGYNQIIFDKLHVQSRTEAVARARELGLL